MSDWTSGYVADIGYTFGYYQELNPIRVKLAFLNAGLAYPEISTACELGFGQGLSVNIHAAGSGITWSGTDFNPAQAAFAQDVAAASGAGAKLSDQSFAEYCGRADLPAFDFIGLHGIWSWISAENQAVIVDFVRRKLKVGGVFYISYNTLPGWAAVVPMRHLLTQHAEVMATGGRGIVSRVDAALEFGDRLMATNPKFASANPQMADRMEKILGQNRHYLAHEYFNRDWLPIHFAEMADWLAPAKLTYACSAHLLDHVDTVNLTSEQQTFLSAIPDAMFRESVRDFMVNQQFRRDYWVKGARCLSPLEKAEGLRAQKVCLAIPAADVVLNMTGPVGEANMAEAVYNPILDVLADLRPKTIGQIETLVRDKGVSLGHLQEAVIILAGKGDLVAVQDEKTVTKARPQTDRINRYLMNKARGCNDISFLASPLTGGGVAIGRFQQLFLSALASGKQRPAEWGADAWQILAAQGQSIIKDGKMLATPEENLTELTAQANELAEKRLPVLKALGVV